MFIKGRYRDIESFKVPFFTAIPAKFGNAWGVQSIRTWGARRAVNIQGTPWAHPGRTLGTPWHTQGTPWHTQGTPAHSPGCHSLQGASSALHGQKDSSRDTPGTSGAGKSLCGHQSNPALPRPPPASPGATTSARFVKPK